ncbi:MAG: exosortase/archaeosortase family protein [Bryobacteraceae bacterium]
MASVNLPISKNLWGSYVTTVSLLLLVCYWSTITGTVQVLFQTGDMACAIFPPVIAAYVIWSRRSQWPSTAIAPNANGAAALLAGAALAALAVLGGSLTLARFAFLFSLVGCILVACGATILRFLAFPLTLLLFALPIPSPLYHALALPLQAVAGRGAEIILNLLGFHAVRTGNSISLPSQILVVSQACSGVQSLRTLAFFCLIYSYWNESRIWLRAALVAAVLPASILMNIVRISVTGMLGEFNHKYTQGTWHSALGYVTSLLAFCVIWGVHTLVSHGFDREAAAA